MQQFAALNRRIIKEEILDGMKLHEEEEFTTVHNYIDTDKMILRKGAVSAQKSERLLIPLNMRDGSLICTGLGNKSTNFSAPHGAGRKYSRKDAENSFTLSAFKTSNSVYAAKEKEDTSVLYARSRQQKKQGKLFIHFNDWGIDICLTDSSDYYLSYLIKNALVNGEWQTQQKIGMNVCQKCSKYKECKSIWECQYNDTVVLQSHRPPKNGKIIFIPRVNIANKNLLGALSAEDLVNEKYDFTLPTGYAKQWRISICALLETADEEEARKIAKKYNNNVKIEDKYWKLAKESLGYNNQ